MAHPMSITIAEFQNRVSEYARDCYDNLAQQSDFTFEPGDFMTYIAGEDNLFGASVRQSGKLTDWAFRQIAERLDAPSTRWLGDKKHCPPELKNDILNKLVSLRDPARLLIRSKGEIIRAVLSDEYTKFDNKELVDMVGEAIATMGVAPEVHRTEIGDEMRGYILIPQITFNNDPTKPIIGQGLKGTSDWGVHTSATQSSPYGDGGLHPAVYISNSERGGGSAKIVGAVYRYVCGNGMIWGWDSQEIFSIRHRFVSMNAMKTLVGEAMAIAFKMSEEAARAFVASQEVHLEKANLKGLISEWSNKYGISVEATDNWLAVTTGEAMGYGRGNDPRLFDLVNGATYVAQQRDSNERQMMERMAGDILRSRMVRRNNEQ